MFKVGEYIICGENGVCRVKEVGTIDIDRMDKEKLYYTLEPMSAKDCLVYTPVDNDKVIMRNVMTKDEAMKLIEDIPYIETAWIENDKQCERVYKEAMMKYECREWIKIVKTFYLRRQERLAQGKKTLSTDDRYLNTAKEYLISEFAVSLGIQKDKVEDLIEKQVKMEKEKHNVNDSEFN